MAPAPEAMPAIHVGSAVVATHLLTECKFLSKRSGFRCPCAPALTSHKRGHLSVSCSNGHQVRNAPCLHAPSRFAFLEGCP